MAASGAHVTALDISASRLKRLSANLERLGLKADIAVSSLFEWEPETLFDAVLLDAPCSSTGTMRRHPDVAWTKSAQDVAKLADLQFRMLAHAVRFVKPGGRLLFSNCSLMAQEGEALYAQACTEIEGIKPEPVNPNELPGLEHVIYANGCLRSTPADLDLGDPAISGMDGFFAARFIRTG
jgi:16S rRNA (cytosine967-C5)-methyltransferase